MMRTGTSMLDLVETVLVRYGIQSLRYDGKMRSDARDATLTAFRKIGGPRVILISIKCGGVGLNLTSANRVVKYSPSLFFIPACVGFVLFVLTLLFFVAWISRGILLRNHRRMIVFIVLDRRRTYL